MAQSRFENGPRGWSGEEGGGYAGDRFREDRDEGYRSRDAGRSFRREGGQDERGRYRERYEGRFQDRGQEDYGALGEGFDRWQVGGRSMGSGGYGARGRDDDRRGFGGGGGGYGGGRRY